MFKFFRGIKSGLAAVLTVAAAYVTVLIYMQAQRKVRSLEFEKRYALEENDGYRAMRASEKARDAQQRVNQLKREFINKRDALRRDGQVTAAEILDRLNKHARS